MRTIECRECGWSTRRDSFDLAERQWTIHYVWTGHRPIVISQE